MVKSGRIGFADQATRPPAQAPAGLGDTASVRCAGALPICKKLRDETSFRIREGGPVHKTLRNPDGPEAAVVIEALVAALKPLLAVIDDAVSIDVSDEELRSAHPEDRRFIKRARVALANATSALAKARGEQVPA